MAQWDNDPFYLCAGAGLIPSPEKQVKDSVLLQLWHRSQLWLRFHAWPGNFYMLLYTFYIGIDTSLSLHRHSVSDIYYKTNNVFYFLTVL